MSAIDERIVQMVFDNKQFESGVSTTLQTIGKLKDSLNFNGQKKALSELSSTANRLDFSGFSGAVEGVTGKFSALETVAIGALLEIGRKAEAAGEKIVKSLTIDQVSSGWSKFENATRNTIATMNQTDKSLEEVEKEIDMLNWYSDVTSFSTEAMTNALTRFTSSGVDLETAIKAIIGIGNSVTYAGKSAQEGSQAFAIWARAIGSGRLMGKELNSLDTMGFLTAKMKQEFIDAAVAIGNLKKGEVTIENFRDTLNADDTKGWLSTEVMMRVFGEKYGKFTKNIYEFTRATEAETGEVLTLSEALKRYDGEVDEFGQKVLLTSTLARTLTDAIDAAKDAASSGWAEVFKYIIGNAEEATDVWTALNDVLVGIFAQPVKNLANLVKTWNELGGRSDLLEGIRNLYAGLSNLGDRFQEAVDKFYIKFKAQDLVNITRRFRDLAVLFRHFTTTNSFFTDDFSTPLDKQKERITKKAEDIYLALNDVTEEESYKLYEKTKKRIRDKALEIAGVPEEVAKEAPPALTRLERAAQGLVSVLEILNNFFDGIKDNIKVLAPAAGKLANKFLDIAANIGDVITKVKDYLKEHDTFNRFFNTTFKIVNNVVSAILDFVPSIDSIKDKFVEFVKRLDPVKQKIIEFFNTLKEKEIVINFTGIIEKLSKGFSSLLDILKDIGKFFAPIIEGIGESLSNAIDNFRLNDSLKTVNTGLITVLLSRFLVLSKGISAAGGSLKDFSGVFSKLNDASEGKGFLGGLGALFSAGWTTFKADIFSVFSPLIEFFKQISMMKASAETIRSIAVSLGILTASVFVLSTINTQKLIGAVVALSLCMKMLTKALTTISIIAPSDRVANVKALGTLITAIIPLAAAVLLVSFAVKKLGSLDLPGLAKGLGGVVVLFYALHKFLDALVIDKKNATGIKALAKALIPLGISLILFAQAVKMLGSLDLPSLGKGLGSVAAGLTEIGVFFYAMKSLGNTGKIASSVLMLSLGLLALTAPIAILGKMKPEQLYQGIGFLGLALAGMSGAFAMLNNTNNILSSAAGFIALAIALNLLVPAIVALGLIPADTIKTSLITLAGAFGILLVAALGIQKLGLKDELFTLAGAIALVGAGAFLLGAGLLAAGAGLTSLSAGLTAFLAAVLGALPLAIQLFWAFLEGVLGGLLQFLIDIGKLIIEAIPTLLEVAGTLLTALLQFILEYAPAIISTVLDIIVMLMNALAEKLPELVNAGVDLIIAFIDGLASTVIDKGPELIRAISNLMNSIIIFIMTVLQSLLKDIPVVGDAINTYFDEKKAELAAEYAPSEGEKIGSGFAGGIATGADSKKTDLVTAFSGLGSASADGFNPSQFNIVGENSVTGISTGAENKKWSLISKFKSIAAQALEATNSQLGINSPSKAFMETGKYSVEGFALGLDKYSYLATDSSSKLGETTIDSFSESLSKIRDSIDSDFDDTLTITPVLDLSEIQNGAGIVDGMFSNPSVSPAFLTSDAERRERDEMLNTRLNTLEKLMARLVETAQTSQQMGTAQAIKEALSGTGVYLDRSRVGQLVTDYQGNARRARGV